MGSVGSVDSASSPHKPAKEARKLACRLCQKRKKKCNRKSPCSMCIKLKVVCQPSAPAAPRKRRQSTKDLFARLAWCEEQLRRNLECRQCLECTSSTEKSTAEIAKRLSEIKADPNISSTTSTPAAES
ncbi:Zn(2)-C6 fungal-type domain-containing protein [Trichoderma simmonsii]|uniref:Zn(2)-C6 fungal-type domain-containing protein n=1 Tax=Trichoderma simmonsii TaxID=1491479 RepID=A0A8G0KZD6_9HYPO|nr:Zn(2)-C6 fungal-type domain-containing protein [Trichoderma simmonsii]